MRGVLSTGLQPVLSDEIIHVMKVMVGGEDGQSVAAGHCSNLGIRAGDGAAFGLQLSAYTPVLFGGMGVKWE